jgi:hypothetical protein
LYGAEILGAEGECYAEAQSTDASAKTGATRVFRVQLGEPKLVATYDWYVPKHSLSIFCGYPEASQDTLMRYGFDWGQSGTIRFARSEDSILAFYSNGKLVRSYSSNEFVIFPGQMFGVRCAGYGLNRDEQYIVTIGTTLGRKVRFDMKTGEKLPPDYVMEPYHPRIANRHESACM